MDRSKNSIESWIDGLDATQLEQHMRTLEARFGCRGSYVLDTDTLLTQALKALDLPTGNFASQAWSEIQEHIELQQTEANRVHLRARSCSNNLEGRARKVAQDVRSYGLMVLACKKALHNAATVAPDLEMDMDTEADEDPAKWTKSFKIINYILDVCRDNKFFKRRSGTGAVYMRAFVTDQGVETCHYEQLGTVAQLVQHFTQEQTNFKMFKLSTDEPRTFDHVVKVLSERLTSRFPFLEPDRHVFSFRNGALKVDEEDEQHRPLFIPYSARDYRMSDFVAANHFDVDMPDYAALDNFRSIPTPAVDKVTSSQYFPDTVSAWLFAMMGRAMFDVRERDAWRVVPWLVGQSNTGKSTILDFVVKKFYQLQDVGILDNQLQTQFHLHYCKSKFVMMGIDVTEKFTMDAAHYQSVSTGEAMSTAEKGGHGAANAFDWKVPMLMACNHFPRWEGADPEAIANRSLIFKHDRVVLHRDPTLYKQLASQMPSIMYKAAWAYLTFSDAYPVLEAGVPGMDYFNRRTAEIRGAVSVDARFIAEKLSLEEAGVAALGDIRAAYEDFLTECNRRERGLSSFRHVQQLLRTMCGRTADAEGVFFGVSIVQ